jgi:prepilin-type N-terminal cleavage/methylation domain-containing protein
MSLMSNKAGFTVVELIVVITVLGILSGLVFFTLGDFYTSNTTSLGVTTQDTDTRGALRQIDRDVATAVDFSDTLATTDPLGPAIGTTTWTYAPTPEKMVLIASTYATVPTTGMIIYNKNGASACNNDPLVDTLSKVKSVFFVAANPQTGQDSLYRRTITDPNACTSQGISQKTSCAVGVSTTTYPVCASTDALILDNVQWFKLRFFQNPTDQTAVTGAAINSARTVEISIKTQAPRGNLPATTAVVRINLAALGS